MSKIINKNPNKIIRLRNWYLRKVNNENSQY